MNQNLDVVHLADLIIFVGHEVRGQVAAFELHPFNQIDFGLRLATFFDGDDSVLADLQQGVGQDAADFLVVVTGDGSDGFNRLAIGGRHGLRHLLEVFDDRFHGLLHTAAQSDRSRPSCDELQTFAEHRFGEDRGGRGAVPGRVAGLAGRFLHQLDTTVLEFVFQLDVLSDGHAVLGDLRSAPAFVENRITASWSQGAGDSPSQLGDALQELLTSIFVKTEQFSHS